jgi:PAS domain S-box-containing protein
MIDLQTIVISYIITNLVCASLVLLLWLQNRRRFAGLGFWVGHYLALFAGMVLMTILRTALPAFLSMVVSNVLTLLGLILFLIGLERYTGKIGPQTHNFIFVGVFALVHAYFALVNPNLLARNLNANLGVLWGVAQILWLIFRRSEAGQARQMRELGAAIFAYGLVSVARIVADLLVPPGNDFLKANSTANSFLFYQIFQVALTLNLFLIVNRRLIVGLEHDILERKRAEEAARASAVLYRQMFANHSASMLLIEPETGEIVEANLAAVKFYGYPVEALQGMNIQQINGLTPDEITALRQKVKDGTLNYFSVPHRLASGELRDVEVYSVPIDVNERALLYSIIHDITERKQAEEALIDSELRFRAVIQSDREAIISANSVGGIIGWNRGAEITFGYSETEVMGQTLTMLMPDHFQSEHVGGMARVQSGGEKHLIGKMVELQGLHKDGYSFPMEMSLSEWQVGGDQCYTAIIRDITERKQAEAIIQQTQVRVLEQERIVATLEERERVARELHDGIGQILGYVNVQAQASQALLEKDQLGAVQKNLEEIVQVAQEAHANLRQTILGLREPAKSQRDFCQALQAYLNSFHQAWGLETVFSPPHGEIPTLPATVEDQLLHIVLEALINIRKHARARRIELLITLQAGEMVVIISDDGQGFDLQAALGTEQGHFGLSIMRERAELVGGRLEIRASAGRGTQVLVHIPSGSKPAAGESPKDMYSLRILLVDDQPLFLDGMRNLLKVRGLTVVGAARDGLEACEQVRALRPDVVLMDVQMPRCDGIEATRRIKTEFPETKVVLLTVSEADEHLLDAIKYGASSYLLKNLDANQLFSTLDGLARDEIQIAPELASRLLKEFNRTGDLVRSTESDESFPAELTLRQWEVLRLIARGITYKEAGFELHLTEPAIKYHMAQILERLQLKNREQAVAYLRQVEAVRKHRDTRPNR